MCVGEACEARSSVMFGTVKSALDTHSLPSAASRLRPLCRWCGGDGCRGGKGSCKEKDSNRAERLWNASNNCRVETCCWSHCCCCSCCSCSCCRCNCSAGAGRARVGFYVKCVCVFMCVCMHVSGTACVRCCSSTCVHVGVYV